MSFFYVHGTFNVRKCLEYLRGIGADIDDATAAEWADAEKAHRFAGAMKRVVAEGWDWFCRKGHLNYTEWRRGQRRGRYVCGDKCKACGEPLGTGGQVRWTETADGVVRDYRPEAERWKPLNWETTEFDSGGPATGGVA